MVRNPGRLLAPIAIIAVAVALLLILRGNLGSHHAAAAAPATAAPVRITHHHVPVKTHRPAFYTVRSGDTLSAIAARTHVGLARLEALNPSLAPSYTLHTGQRLRLPQ